MLAAVMFLGNIVHPCFRGLEASNLMYFLHSNLNMSKINMRLWELLHHSASQVSQNMK